MGYLVLRCLWSVLPVWTNPFPYRYSSSYQPSPEHRFWVAIIIISIQNSKRHRILFWNNLKPILWQGQVDVCSFMNPLAQTKGKSQGRFYSNQLNTLLEVIKSDNQSWVRLVPLCSLCFHSCTSNTSFYEKDKWTYIFTWTHLEGTSEREVKYNQQKTASRCY